MQNVKIFCFLIFWIQFQTNFSISSEWCETIGKTCCDNVEAVVIFFIFKLSISVISTESYVYVLYKIFNLLYSTPVSWMSPKTATAFPIWLLRVFIITFSFKTAVQSTIYNSDTSCHVNGQRKSLHSFWHFLQLILSSPANFNISGLRSG